MFFFYSIILSFIGDALALLSSEIICLSQSVGGTQIFFCLLGTPQDLRDKHQPSTISRTCKRLNQLSLIKQRFREAKATCFCFFLVVFFPPNEMIALREFDRNTKPLIQVSFSRSSSHTSKQKKEKSPQAHHTITLSHSARRATRGQSLQLASHHMRRGGVRREGWGWVGAPICSSRPCGPQ